MIEIQNVNKIYPDGYHALKNINLTFHKGEVTVLIGPSGCGKSTTMKLINRLILPSNGKILINGDDISTIDPVKLRRNIGYVIQSIGLFPHMTIGRNVGVVPHLKKWDKQRIDKRVEELMDMVGLSASQYKNRYPSELSGGQQQRIGVIRAMAADPEIILMDEPFSALDPISREQLQDDIVRLQQELHKTIVFVTHDMDEALKIADRIVIMQAGVVVQSDKPERILRRPANDFVRSFIGQQRLEQEHAAETSSYDIPLVDDVMIRQPVTIYPNRGLAEAITIMERRRVDSLFITDRNRKLQGIVSIFNVLEHYGNEDMTVADVMKPIAYSLPSGTPLPNAVEMLSLHQLSNLAIVDGTNRLVGLITRGSVVRHLAEVLPVLPPEPEDSNEESAKESGTPDETQNSSAGDAAAADSSGKEV
ncbi:ABC transporter ATP-binding protein [Paenibacillus protaetiae]|uniref:Quaternary amine transport ATP-binding protein n=1 Tax=Paenibacillus protaetiae TaxID=2509456 RepID=A0A4P6EYK4_9BACL|nr:ABC transporter ATP-binding protein [Paenibacillus protaetiae]QAY66869.1 ATP-binding cassette domain-containing protein [Paenibacillus protaetiae]